MRILLADDSQITRRLFNSVLLEGGHLVTEVENGHDAWAAFEREPMPLVILDWMMPELDGLEVTRRIRASANGAETFVLMVTGRGTPADVLSALAAGVDDFVVKPVAPEHLRARILIAAQRIEAVVETRSVEAALRHARWLAGVGETALALQHEINNPLLAILLETELLSTDPAMPADAVERLNAILGQTKRIADLVKRISALKNPQTIDAIEGMHMLDLSERRPTAS